MKKVKVCMRCGKPCSKPQKKRYCNDCLASLKDNPYNFLSQTDRNHLQYIESLELLEKAQAIETVEDMERKK